MKLTYFKLLVIKSYAMHYITSRAAAIRGGRSFAPFIIPGQNETDTEIENLYLFDLSKLTSILF